MNYISPESVVYTSIDVVGTSVDDFTPPSTSNNGSSSGGIQLPFIPG